MTVKTHPFDPADYIKTPEDEVAYLSSAMESGDVAVIADALGVVARARGMATVAEATGLSRESLYRALCKEGNPQLATVLGVLRALGIRLSATGSPATRPRVTRAARQHTSTSAQRPHRARARA